MKRAAFLALGTAFLIGCQDEPPTGPDFADDDNPLFEIQDALHGGGNEHFFFLPPIVPAPDFEGVFNATRSPAVEICLVDQDMCAAEQPEGFPIVFTMDDGPGSENVRVSAEDEHYIVNWHTKQFDLDPDATYRIRVLEPGLLGVADVRGGKEWRDALDQVPDREGLAVPRGGRERGNDLCAEASEG